MPILNVHAGSLPSFAIRMKQDDTLDSIRQRSAKKIRLQLDDGIPLVIKYGWEKKTYTLEDSEYFFGIQIRQRVVRTGKRRLRLDVDGTSPNSIHAILPSSRIQFDGREGVGRCWGWLS